MAQLDTRIAAAEAKLKQLKARQQRALARKRSITAKNQRSQELRRKILIGATVLARVETGEISAADLRRWLDQGVTRDDDRALFELPPKAPRPPA